MKKVNSPVEMLEVLYKINSTGMADVWIRKNQEKVTRTDDSALDGIAGYEADEVYFRVSPKLIPESEIIADSDFFFNQMKEEEDCSNADHLAIANYRASKREEISRICENTIHNGIDVQLSGGTEHFSLKDKDQMNLFGKQVQLSAGAKRIEYHQDGNPCKWYSAEDMTAVTTAAMSFVSFHTTYCNSMFTWIDRCSKASEMAEITYGAAVPVEFQSEVLADYLTKQSE